MPLSQTLTLLVQTMSMILGVLIQFILDHILVTQHLNRALDRVEVRGEIKRVRYLFGLKNHQALRPALNPVPQE
jgi:hypothetical protein